MGLVSRYGKLYAFGNNDNAQCGLPKDVTRTVTPTMVRMEAFTFVINAECGNWHSLILSSKYQILSCGSENYTGNGKEKGREVKLIKSLENEVITCLAAGPRHSLCLSKEHDVWSWGSGVYGPLGHGNGNNVLTPMKIQYFADNDIEIESIYAAYDQSAAISVDKCALYVWGSSDDGIGDSEYCPERMDVFGGDDKILSVALGQKYIGIIKESKEESKEREFVLKSGEEMTVQNGKYDVESKKVHNVYLQNQELFGDDEWIEIKRENEYISFPYFGHEFVENLVMNKDKNMIELVKCSEIETIYHSDIIGAEFFVYLNDFNGNIIKIQQEKKDFMDKAQKYSFDKIEEIAFKIPENQKNVSIYVQPNNANSIYLLKQFNL